MNPTIDADDILNAVYEHAHVKFECEGCGDDSRDGSKLARKKLDELIAKIYAQGRKEGLKEMDEAYELYGLVASSVAIEHFRQEYAS